MRACMRASACLRPPPHCTLLAYVHCVNVFNIAVVSSTVLRPCGSGQVPGDTRCEGLRAAMKLPHRSAHRQVALQRCNYAIVCKEWLLEATRLVMLGCMLPCTLVLMVCRRPNDHQSGEVFKPIPAFLYMYNFITCCVPASTAPGARALHGGKPSGQLQLLESGLPCLLQSCPRNRCALKQLRSKQNALYVFLAPILVLHVPSSTVAPASPCYLHRVDYLQL